MEHNLDKIKKFLYDILEGSIVENVFIDLNYLYEENREVKDIRIEDFSKNVMREYIENDYFAPVISGCIRK